MSVDWQTASDRFHRFASLDPSLQAALNAANEAEARDEKLATKLEEGRTYGMQQQYYNNKMKRDLASSLRVTGVTEDHW